MGSKAKEEQFKQELYELLERYGDVEIEVVENFVGYSSHIESIDFDSVKSNDIALSFKGNFLSKDDLTNDKGD